MKRLAFVIAMVGIVDLGSALLYWGARDVSPAKVLWSMARWVAPTAPLQWTTVALGAFVDFAIYAVLVVLFHAMFGHARQARRHWAPIGALFGISAYVAVFHILVPLLIYPAQLPNPATWVAVCACLHAFLIGPLIAYGVLGPWAISADHRHGARPDGVGWPQARSEVQQERRGSTRIRSRSSHPT